MTALPPNDRGPGVAAFDFDGTLTTGDSLGPFLLHGLGVAGFAAVLASQAVPLAAFVLGLRSNEHAKARLLRAALAGRTVDELQRWSQHLLSHWLPQHTRASALERLRAHQARGDACVLVSASPDIYLEAVARHWGFDALLCTQLAIQDQRLTGELTGRNCHGPEKVRRLLAWRKNTLGDPATWTLHAYGDSLGDKDMLALADYPHWIGKPAAATHPRAAP